MKNKVKSLNWFSFSLNFGKLASGVITHPCNLFQTLCRKLFQSHFLKKLLLQRKGRNSANSFIPYFHLKRKSYIYCTFLLSNIVFFIIHFYRIYWPSTCLKLSYFLFEIKIVRTLVDSIIEIEKDCLIFHRLNAYDQNMTLFLLLLF